jgi:hypothetical protein
MVATVTRTVLTSLGDVTKGKSILCVLHYPKKTQSITSTGNSNAMFDAEIIAAA